MLLALLMRECVQDFALWEIFIEDRLDIADVNRGNHIFLMLTFPSSDIARFAIATPALIIGSVSGLMIRAGSRQS